MIRAANLTQGMVVVTPGGAIARVEGAAIHGEDIHVRVNLFYLDPERQSQPLQAKLLKPYIGPPVLFPDEAERYQRRYEDRPLSARPAGLGD